MSNADPRAALNSVLDWQSELVATVTDADLDRGTPCADFDVRALLQHQLDIVERLSIAGQTGAVEGPASVPPVQSAGELSSLFDDSVSRGRQVWSDDTLLAKPITAPFGTMPGSAFATAFTSEIAVHNWDLATALGQPAEAPDAGIAEACLAFMTDALPPAPRDDSVPFDDPVEPAADATPTERLANWTGRVTPRQRRF